MQKWEYCALEQGPGPSGALTFFKTAGSVYQDMRSMKDAEFPGSTIAQLGLDGWEMVGIKVIEERYTTLYFKRPLP